MTHNDNPQTVPEVQEEALQEGQDNTEVAADAVDPDAANAAAECETPQADKASADAPA